MAVPTPPKSKLSITTHNLGKGTGSTDLVVVDYQRDALLVSENHRRNKKGKYLEGGPLFVSHDSVKTQKFPMQALRAYAGGPYIYQPGSFITPAGGYKVAPLSLPDLPDWSAEQSALSAKGATGWKRARPGNPYVDGLVAAKELLTDGIPTLPGRLLARVLRFRSLGNEYLNVAYGWLPLISDIQKMVELWEKQNDLIAQLMRDNGRSIRRRRGLGKTLDCVSTIVYDGPVISGAFLNAPNGAWSPYTSGRYRLTKIVTTEERWWFSGSFRYWIPDISSPIWLARAKAVLWGGIPTPSAVWQALPWSWLVDWFSNVGDVLSNLSPNAVDNLVAEYAYVMHHKKVTTYYEAVGQWPSLGSVQGGYVALINTETVETKSRMPATPFGFGVTWDGLSPYQAGILAALGISRSRF